MALRYTTFKMTASANSGGTSSVHHLAAGLRGATVQIAQSGSITGMSCLIKVMGTHAASGYVTSGYLDVRVGSLAVATATDQASALLLNAFAGSAAPGTADFAVFPFKYMKFLVQTLSQGTPILLVGGYVDDTLITGSDTDVSSST